MCVCEGVHTFSLRVFILRPPINFPPSDSAMVSAPPNNVLLEIKDANVVWKKESPSFFFFSPQRPYLWFSDGGRDVYVNLTQAA